MVELRKLDQTRNGRKKACLLGMLAMLMISGSLVAIRDRAGRRPGENVGFGTTVLKPASAEIADASVDCVGSGSSLSPSVVARRQGGSQAGDTLDLSMFRFPESAQELDNLIDRLRGITSNEHLAEALRLMGLGLSEDEIVSALKRIRGHRNVWRIIKVALSKWAEQDPESTASWVAALYGLQPNNAYLESFLKSACAWWGEQDHIAAFEWIKGIATEKTRSTLLYVMATAVPATFESSGFMKEVIEAITSQAFRAALIRSVTERLAHTDPLKAVIWANEASAYLNRDEYRAGTEDLVSGIVASWAAKDLKAARAWLETLPYETTGSRPFEVVARAFMKKEGLAAVLYWAENLDNPITRKAALIAAASAWDGGGTPEASAALMTHVCNAGIDASTLKTAVKKWAAKTPDAAANWLEQLADPALRVSATAGLVAGWLAVDEDAVFRFVENLAPGAVAAAAELEAVRFLAGFDPREAYEWAKNNCSADSRAKAYMEIASEWIVENREDAKSWAKNLPDGELRDNVMRQVASELADYGSRESLDFALQMSPGTDRTKTVDWAFSLWAGREPRTAAQWVSAYEDTKERDRLIGIAASSLACVDPGAALELSSAMPQGKSRSRVESLAALSLVRRTPAADCLDVVNQLPDDNEQLRTAVIPTAALMTARDDPQKAISLIDEVSGQEDRAAVAAAISTSWAANSPEDAAEWARGLADEHMREQAVAAAIRKWTSSDMDAAIRWIDEMPDGPARWSAIGVLTTMDAMTDVAFASAIASDLPEGYGREQAMATVTAYMAAADPVNAYDWVNALPAGRSKDLALQAFVESDSLLGFELQKELAATIADKGIRESTLEYIKNEQNGRYGRR